MVRAGTLRHRITFQRPVEGDPADSLGERAVTWSNVVTVSAAVLPQSGREFYRAQQVIAEMTHLISARYRSGIDETLRIQLGRRTLKILSVMRPDERDEEMLIACVESP